MGYHHLTLSEKKKFIKDLCNGMRDDLLKEVSKMPEDWDGHELREIIAERAVRNRSPYMDRARTKAFKNEVLRRNL